MNTNRPAAHFGIFFQLIFNNSVLKHDPLFLLGALLVAPICWSHLVAQGCVLHISQLFLNDFQHVPPAAAYRPSTCCNFGNVETTHISNEFCICCDLNICFWNIATFRRSRKHTYSKLHLTILALTVASIGGPDVVSCSTTIITICVFAISKKCDHD